MGDTGTRLRQFRESQELSQGEFAVLLGVSTKKISDVERGRTALNEKFMMLLHDKFGLSIDSLLTGEGALQARQTGPKVDPTEMRELLHNVRSLLETREMLDVAENAPEYRAAGHARRIPLFKIEGDARNAYDGNGTPRGSTEFAACPDSVADPLAFAARLIDDSMFPEFREGDILIFSTSDEIRTGDFAWVHTGTRSTFRQVFLEDEGSTLRLAPVNREYPEIRADRTRAHLFRLVWRMTRY